MAVCVQADQKGWGGDGAESDASYMSDGLSVSFEGFDFGELAPFHELEALLKEMLSPSEDGGWMRAVGTAAALLAERPRRV